MNQIKFAIKGIDDDLFAISNVSRIIAYPSETELPIEKLSLDSHTSFKFFYGFPDEQGRSEDKHLLLKTSDIIYMKVTL